MCTLSTPMDGKLAYFSFRDSGFQDTQTVFEIAIFGHEMKLLSNWQKFQTLNMYTLFNPKNSYKKFLLYALSFYTTWSN